MQSVEIADSSSNTLYDQLELEPRSTFNENHPHSLNSADTEIFEHDESSFRVSDLSISNDKSTDIRIESVAVVGHNDAIIGILGDLNQSLSNLYSISKESHPEFKLNLEIMKQQIQLMSHSIPNPEIATNTASFGVRQLVPDMPAISTIQTTAQPKKKLLKEILKRPVLPKRQGRNRLKLKTYGVLSANEAIGKIEEEKREKETEIALKLKKKQEIAEQKAEQKAKEDDLKLKIKSLQTDLKVLKSSKPLSRKNTRRTDDTDGPEAKKSKN